MKTKTISFAFLAGAILTMVMALPLGSNNYAYGADSTRPTVSFSTPSNGATVSGSLYVRVSASDNVGISSVKLYLDGSTNLVNTELWDPYEFYIDTTKYGNGLHYLKATATDTSGNTRSTTIQVTFANQVPKSTGQWTIGVYPIKTDSGMRAVVDKHREVTLISNFRLDALDKFSQGPKMALAESHDRIITQIRDIKSSGLAVKYIGYDNERSNGDLSTPPAELVDPALSTNEAMDIIRAAGFQTSAGPTRSLLKEELLGVKWDKVDLLALQMQKVVGSSEFYDLTTRVAQVVRPQNPDILIIIQISPSLYSNAEIVQSLQQVKPYIDGVSVMWDMDDERVLDDLLTRLESM